ncbi:helix-turn-helix domain-containing protein [Streptomyces fradiae]|uniref:helix-turn-helix domain-containing protein n=1 Tax=Streptomyces fradiae TaxID=1906 RepID=UPI0035BE7637
MGDKALLEEEPQLPPPAERARLREAAGVTQARLASALKWATQTVKNWENGRSEPKPPRLEAYRRLLDGWAAQYPAPGPAGLLPEAAPTAPPPPAPAAPPPTPAAPGRPPAPDAPGPVPRGPAPYVPSASGPQAPPARRTPPAPRRSGREHAPRHPPGG